MTFGKIVSWVCLCTLALSVGPVTVWAQSTYDTQEESLIFPLFSSAKAKKGEPSPYSPSVASPVQKAAYAEPVPTAPPLSAGPKPDANGYAPSYDQPPQEETCPECGRGYDRPFLGLCSSCMRPGQRLLEYFRPGLFDRHPGGNPAREPWMTRPWSMGIFMGGIVGSPLMDEWVGQQGGFLDGFRLGYDFDDDWGVELRVASASIALYDSAIAVQTRWDSDLSSGLSPNSLEIQRAYARRDADHFIVDLSMLYYPWGDADCRPYLLFGLGFDRVYFSDRMRTTYMKVLVDMPVGVGFKHRLSDWLVFRAELLDNVAFAGGSDINTQHNVSLTGGLEVRLGKSRSSYWPWNPGMKVF